MLLHVVLVYMALTEILVAHLTNIWSFPCVDTVMPPQIRGLCEPLPALGAGNRLLTSMHHKVFLQFATLSEARTAEYARKRSVTCVESSMTFEVTILEKCLPTLTTDEVLFTKMSLLMILQVTFLYKGFVAFRALEGPLACVVPLVEGQLYPLYEAESTHLTHVWPLTRVDHHMSL